MSSTDAVVAAPRPTCARPPMRSATGRNTTRNSSDVNSTGRRLHGLLARLARADPNGLVDRQHEHLTVADGSRLGGADDRRADLVDEVVGDDDLDLDLGQEVDGVLRAAIQLGVALLAPEAPHLGDGHPDDADLGERLLHVVELEGLDDRLDLLHGVTPRRGWAASGPRRGC